MTRIEAALERIGNDLRGVFGDLVEPTFPEGIKLQLGPTRVLAKVFVR